MLVHQDFFLQLTQDWETFVVFHFPRNPKTTLLAEREKFGVFPADTSFTLRYIATRIFRANIETSHRIIGPSKFLPVSSKFLLVLSMFLLISSFTNGPSMSFALNLSDNFRKYSSYKLSFTKYILE